MTNTFPTSALVGREVSAATTIRIGEASDDDTSSTVDAAVDTDAHDEPEEKRP